MPTTLPPVPSPPPAQVRRLDKDGKPIEALVIYETKLKEFLQAMKAAIEAGG